MDSPGPALRIVMGRPKARRAGLLSVFSASLAMVALFFPIERSWMALPAAAIAVGSLLVALVLLRFETPRNMLVSAGQRALVFGSVPHAVDVSRSERAQRLQALGSSRLLILGCLGGDFPSLPQYFEPAPGEDVVAAFRKFVERSVRDAGHDPDRLTQSLLGAARLLIGDLSGADTVLAQLPEALRTRTRRLPPVLIAPAQVMIAVLPLGSLQPAPAASWVAGSDEQARVRHWLNAHRSRLVWNERDAIYELARAVSTESEPHAIGR
jgi:hypothetical protein